MDVIILAFVSICGISPINGWTGDRDTGPTCVKVEQEFKLIGQCRNFIDNIYEQSNTLDEQSLIGRQVRGPWRIKGECRLQYRNEMIGELQGPLKLPGQ